MYFDDNVNTPRHSFQTFFDSQSNAQQKSAYKLFISLIRFNALALSTSVEIQSGHKNGHSATTVAVDAQEGRYILSGGTDGTVALYDLESNINKPRPSTASRQSRGHNFAISSISWHPCDNGAFVSSANDGKVLVWDTNLFECAGEFNLPDRILCSKFNHDGNLISAALSNSSIVLCDPNTGDSSHVLMGHTMGVTSLAWNPKSPMLLASASLDGTVKIWDIRKGDHQAILMSLDAQQDHTATATASFQSVVSERGDGGRLWAGIALSSHDNTSYRTMDWSKSSVARAHDGAVMSIKYTDCGRFIVSSGNDKAVRLWNAHTGALMPIAYRAGCTSTQPYEMEIATPASSVGDTLIVPNGASGDIALLPLYQSTGAQPKVLKGHLGFVTSVAYRKSYQQLISAAKDGLILVWEAKRQSSRPDSTAPSSFRSSTSAWATHSSSSASASASVRASKKRSIGWVGNGPAVAEEDSGDDADADCWSDDGDGDGGDSASGTGASVSRKSFLPPIIQNYLDEVNSINQPSQPSHSNAQPAVAPSSSTPSVAVDEPVYSARVQNLTVASLLEEAMRRLTGGTATRPIGGDRGGGRVMGRGRGRVVGSSMGRGRGGVGSWISGGRCRAPSSNIQNSGRFRGQSSHAALTMGAATSASSNGSAGGGGGGVATGAGAAAAAAGGGGAGRAVGDGGVGHGPPEHVISMRTGSSSAAVSRDSLAGTATRGRTEGTRSALQRMLMGSSTKKKR